MFKISHIKALKIIILFALLNSSIFYGLHPTGILRLGITILMNISGLLLIIYFFKISKKKFDTNLYFKTMFLLLILWSFYTIFCAFTLNPKTLMTLFGHNLMGWAWLTPLAVVFGFNINNWLLLFNFFVKLLFIGSSLVFANFMYRVVGVFGLLEWMAFLPIMLLTYYYQNKTHKKIILFSLFAYIVLTFSASQRANSIFLLLIILFYSFEFFRQNTIKMYKKLILFFALLWVGFFLVFQIDTYVETISNNQEMNSDTRTFLFVELFSDMSDEELLTGRGALGTYYSPYFAYTQEHGLGGDSSTRSVSEIGYLEMILKGGYIMMALYLLILLPAAYLGIFHSRNIIARMSGYFIVLYLILWLVSYYPVYSVEYILLWMAAGTAISRSTRKVRNNDILMRRKGSYVFAEE